MFWKWKKTTEDEGSERAKKIEGPLWGYMVTRRGVGMDVLQRLRRVEREGFVWDKPVTQVRIFNPAGAEEAGVVVDSYESLSAHPRLILYEGYYRGPEMSLIHMGKAVYEEEKVKR